MKKQVRLLGIDDAPFSFDDVLSSIIGVVMRGGSYIEGVLRDQIEIDGDDATQKISAMILNTRHKTQLRAVLLDGVAVGGFNVVDIEALHVSTGIPVITVTRDAPDLDAIQRALQNNFDDWKRRWDLLTRGTLQCITTKHNPIYVKSVGISEEETKEIITLSTIRGVIPEPIRVAHLIASGITRGESYGKA
jgi:endonuclease V-like protein UPF0215 family